MIVPSTGCADMGERNKTGHQRGASMIEALIASLLLSVLFLGLAHVLSRGLASQRFMNTQNLALLQIRENLQQSEQGIVPLCEGEAPNQITVLSGISLNSSCAGGTIGISLSGLERTVPTRTITVSTSSNATSQGLFGGDGVISLSD
jgi:Tfp pilus assembly protein PilV